MKTNTHSRLATVLLAGFLALISLSAQAAEKGGKYEPPRLASGKPNLQGVWTNASLTRMSRPAEFKDLEIPQEKIEELNHNSYYNRRLREDNKPTDPNAGVFTDGDANKGYNNFWIDPGDSYAKVNGSFRSSWIVEPKDGKIPYSREGQMARARAFRAGGAEDENAAAGQVGRFDGPEMRPLGERCIISFGSTAGPPLNNAMYNNHYQIVQTPEHVMILTEMNHDVRIVDMNGEHVPAEVRPWFGSSVGKWEGDTLVVETRGVHPLQETRGGIPISQQGKVIERFTRVSDEEILYEFTVDDPTYYSTTWRGEMGLHKDDEQIYEYACHEGNYALEGILAGARLEEKEKK